MDGREWAERTEHRVTGLEIITIVLLRTRAVVVEMERECWLWDTSPNLRITMSEHTSYATNRHIPLRFPI